jgi:integrase
MSCRFSRIARRRSEPGRPVRPPAANEWLHTGLFFVKPDGQPWHPELVSERFERLVTDAGLPPIRLHDLRHCAATLRVPTIPSALVVAGLTSQQILFHRRVRGGQIR